MKRVLQKCAAFISYLIKMYKNKFVAIELIVLGICAEISEGYTGLCVISIVIGLWLFFTKKKIFD